MENAAPVVFRLSPLQKALWSNADLRGGKVYGRVEIGGPLDVERLHGCFKGLAERHESLRTFFQLSPGFTFPFQVVRETTNFSWDVYDLQASTDGARKAEIEDLLRAEAWSAVTPFEGPTFSVKVIQIAAEKFVLALQALALCCDHASLKNMVAEVAAMYQDQTVEEAVQYADFSEWHNETVSSASEDLEAAKAFWSASPSVQLLPLTSRFSSSAQPSLASYKFKIDGGTFDAAGSNSESLLLMCWQAMLWRLTNQDVVTVEAVNMGRPLDELELSIGLFARPLPVTVPFEDAPTFDSVAQRTSQRLAEVGRWQAYGPLDAEGTVGFDFTRLPAKIAADAVSFTITELRPLRWPFKLALSCQVSGDAAAFEILYDSMQYTAKDVRRIALYFERTVRAAKDSTSNVFAFDLLDKVEREEVVERFNSEHVDYGDLRPFHQLFEEQAALTPDRPALVFEKTELTYAELNARSNQLAGWLRKNGVGPNTPVGLCMERSAEMILALLGILKAGGSYVPLLPDLPVGRLAHQIGETGIRVIVSAEALVEKLKESDFDGQVLCLDRDAVFLGQESTDNLEHAVGDDDLIYVLYTSGSTGAPKGVSVRHRNITNYVHGITRRLGLKELSVEPGLTFATVSTLGADLGNTSIFPPLVTGGCLVVIGYESAIDGVAFAQRQREHPIDVLKITPSNLNALLASDAAENILPRKYLIVGGEACSWELAERVKTAGVCSMLNHYGPTEATVGCLTYKVFDAGDSAMPQSAIVPLGRPIPNLQVYVLDRELKPLPVGAPGEICISGAGITAGYVDRPDETASKFVPHPFLKHGSLLYRSGDVGRFLTDGSIEFLGRVDDQVKIRGHRVELAEIEAVLNQCAGVQQSVVLFSKDDSGDHLCAYLVATEIAPAAVQDFLRKHLPEYMVPREFVVMEQLPLNANGKVDRKKLAELKPGAMKAESAVVDPRNELEEQLAAIWKETLHCERLSVHDSFFDLGGHSLLATQIISRVRSTLGLNVSIRMLFEAPTIESLALAIETMRVETDDDGELGDLLAELEGLSDSEAEDILGVNYSAETGTAPGRGE